MNGTTLADLTLAALKKKHDRPFFLACGFFNPHMPWYVPQKYFDLFPLEDVAVPKLKADDLDDVPPLGVKVTKGKSRFVEAVLKAGLHKEAVRGYLATTAYVDGQIGRVTRPPALDATQSHSDDDLAFVRELDRVADQVDDHLS